MKCHPRSHYLGRLFGCEITHGNSTYNVDTTNEMVCIDDNRRMMYYERQLREPMQKKIWWWFILWIMNGRHFNKFYNACTSNLSQIWWNSFHLIMNIFMWAYYLHWIVILVFQILLNDDFFFNFLVSNLRIL